MTRRLPVAANFICSSVALPFLSIRRLFGMSGRDLDPEIVPIDPGPDFGRILVGKASTSAQDSVAAVDPSAGVGAY